MYEVLVERAAEKDIKRLPLVFLRRTIPAIKSLSLTPRPPGCRKISGSENFWRFRIGDYRILYEIDDKANTVKIMRVKHRKEAYR
ncbi:MAG: type II toxin-antitoxin system RelE/ParE family toxin [Nitrospinae bacterium]|nr:type II toxin-antitoxin system RelE/ParE family toxin [Nitrospinota bacterium]